jgi:hypothetical protein
LVPLVRLGSDIYDLPLTSNTLKMIRIAIFLLTLLLIATVVVAGVLLIGQFIKNFQPGKSKVVEDIRKMKAGMQLFINDLVPWEKDELDLLSFNQVDKKIAKGMVKKGQGVITSIYHEPMIAWSYRRYLGSGDNAVLYACTSHHEFVYRIRNNGTTIIIDDQEIGQIRENGVLYSIKTNRMMARINREANQLYLPVLVGDKEVATLKSPGYAQQTNSRAFELLATMNDEEEAVLLSLTILEMVSRELK